MDDQPVSPDLDRDALVFTARERALIAEAQADVEAGRLVDWEDVRAWIDSLATPHPLPPPYPK